jgi:YcxB-like protein
MPQLEFRFEISDYVHAQMLHGRRTPVLKCVQFFSRWIAPMMGVLMVVFAISRVVIHGLSESRTELPVSVFIILGVGTTLIIYWPLVRLNWRLCYEKTRSNDGERAFEFSDEAIRTQTRNARSEVEWSAIRSFLEVKNIFLLYFAPAMFFPIPKRACTAERIDDLRELFQQRITQEESN